MICQACCGDWKKFSPEKWRKKPQEAAFGRKSIEKERQKPLFLFFDIGFTRDVGHLNAPEGGDGEIL